MQMQYLESYQEKDGTLVQVYAIQPATADLTQMHVWNWQQTKYAKPGWYYAAMCDDGVAYWEPSGPFASATEAEAEARPHCATPNQQNRAANGPVFHLAFSTLISPL